MSRRAFIIFLISLGLIPTAYGVYHLTGPPNLEDPQQIKAWLEALRAQGLSVEEGIAEIERRLKEEGRLASEVPVEKLQGTPVELEEFLGVPVPKGMDTETFAQIIARANEKVMPEVMEHIAARLDALWARGFSGAEIQRKLEEEGLGEAWFKRRHEELLRAELSKLFAEWEKSKKSE